MPTYRRNRDIHPNLNGHTNSNKTFFVVIKRLRVTHDWIHENNEKLWDNIHPELNHFSDKNLRHCK